MTIDIDSHYPLTADQVDVFRERRLHPAASRRAAPETSRTTAARSPVSTIELNTQSKPLGERSTYDRAFLQVMNLWERSPLVGRFVMGQRLARIAAELLEVAGVRLYHDQSLYKEPGGGITPAHADQYYWPLASTALSRPGSRCSQCRRKWARSASTTRSQSIEFGRDLGISDESEATISANMARHGSEFACGAFELGEVSFHLGLDLPQGRAEPPPQPRSVMTVIYMDAAMRLAQPLNPAQVNDRDQWCPGARPGAVIDTHKNPVIWPLR